MVQGQPLVLLARHGQTAGNQAAVFRSRMDFPLDEKGVQDAHELGAHVAAHYPQVKLIAASPMQRTMQTAGVVAQQTGASVEKDSRLLPWHAGLLTGTKRNPKSEALRDYYVQHAEKPIPGGESIAQSENRMHGVLKAAIHHGQTKGLVLLATHGLGIKAAETLVKGQRNPTGDAAMIEPGGLAGIFQGANGLEMHPLFKGGETPVTS